LGKKKDRVLAKEGNRGGYFEKKTRFLEKSTSAIYVSAETERSTDIGKSEGGT